MAIAAALIIGGVASLASGAMSASAAGNAANTQANAAQQASNTQLQATRESIAAQKEALAQTRSDLAPYRMAGLPALQNYMSLLGLPVTQGMTAGQGLPGQAAQLSAPTAPDRGQFTTSVPGTSVQVPGTGVEDRNSGGPRYVNTPASSKFDQAGFDAATQKYNTDLTAYNAQQTANQQPVQGLQTAQDLTKLPGYNFQMQQGQAAVDSSGASRGMQLSSATLKDLTRFGQGLASGAYQQQLNNLNSLIGVGQNAAAGSGVASQNTGNNISNLTQNLGNNVASNQIGAGNSNAAGQIGQANAIGGALSNIGNIGMQGYMLNSLFPQSGGGSVPSGLYTGPYNPGATGSPNYSLGNVGALGGV